MTVPSVEILKDERLLEWRLERFAEFGFSATESSEPAEPEADWHLAAARAPRRKETPALRTPGPRKDRLTRLLRLSLGRHHPKLGALEVGRTLGGVESYVPEPLEDQLCEECQNSVVTVILSSGQALCTACAAIRFRIPTTDRAQLRAAIEAGTSAGAHWPRDTYDRPKNP